MLNVFVVYIILVVNFEGVVVIFLVICNSIIGKYNVKKVDLFFNFYSMLFSLNVFFYFCKK